MQRIQYDVDLIPGVDHFGIFSIASPKVTFTKETPEGFSSKPMMKEVPKDDQELEESEEKSFYKPDQRDPGFKGPEGSSS